MMKAAGRSATVLGAAAVLWWVAAAATGCSSAPGRASSVNHFSVVYIQDIPFGQVNAQFASGEPSWVLVEGNFWGPPEVGVYEQRLPLEQVTALRDALLQPDFRRFTSTATMQPETATVTVGIWEQPKDQPETRTWVRAEVPPELRHVLDALDKALEGLRQFPKHVVRGAAAWDAPAVKVGADLEFTLKLKNVGSEALKLASPGAPDDGRLPLTLELSRERAPGARPQDGDQEAIELTVSSLRRESSRRSFWSRSRAKLDAGEELQVTLKKAVHLTPGDYAANLFLRMNKAGDADSEVGGWLRLPMGRVTVAK